MAHAKVEMMMKNTITRLYPLVLLLLISACAQTVADKRNYYWPSPPDEPRIVYLGSYKGESDFAKKSFFDALFGETSAAKVLDKPYGVFVLNDKIYVTLTARSALAVIDPALQKVAYIGETPPGRLLLPIGVAVAADGTVFVADSKAKTVYAYTGDGDLKFAVGAKDDFANPAGLAINETLNRLYVVDSYNHKVRVYSLKGEFLFTFGSRGDKPGEFNFPSNIAIDRRDNSVLISDTQNFRVQKFTQDGTFILKFGHIGDVPGSFARPKGVGVDSEGNIYVADAAFNNFQVFDENGQLLMVLGGAGAGPATFQLPAGLYVDSKDRIHIVDSLNGRIQVLQYLSLQWKKNNQDQYRKYFMADNPAEKSKTQQ